MFEHRMAWHTDLGVAWQSDRSVESRRRRRRRRRRRSSSSSSSSSKLYFNSDWRVAQKRLYLREIDKYMYNSKKKIKYILPGVLKTRLPEILSQVQHIAGNLLKLYLLKAVMLLV